MRANVRLEVVHPLSVALGSGVVIQRDGESALIITNRHVVDASFAERYMIQSIPLEKLPYPRVTYFNKQTHPGTVLWVAPDDIDLALLKAACPDEIEPVSWQPGRKVVTGEKVFAIGNPSGLGWTYTSGVVSALRTEKYGNRNVPIVQTDTSISPGSSGGGLYAAAGELIAINSSIVNPQRAQGLGFAIRIDILQELQPAMLNLPGDAPNP
jgi:S1-C subfamily serine protease